MIAREGRLVVISAFSAAVAATALGGIWSAIPLWLIAVALGGVFRETRRSVSNVASDVASPIDGAVDRVDIVDDPWFKRRALRIGIRLRFPWITTVRSPIDGKACQYWTELDDAEEFLPSPTCYALGLETHRAEQLVVATSSERRHSRYRGDVAPGERVGKGLRVGFVFFASRVDIYLPESAEPEVTVGQRVRAGSVAVADLGR